MVCKSILVIAFLALLPVAVHGESRNPRTIADITALLDQYPADPAKVAALRARFDAQPPEDLSPKIQRTFYYDRAWAAQMLGSPREISDRRKALEFSRKLPINDLIEDLQALSNTLLWTGNWVEGIRVREEAMELSRDRPGRQLTLGEGLVYIYRVAGDLAGARRALERTEQGYARASSLPDGAVWREFWVGFINRARGGMLFADRKLEQAEVAYRRAVEAFERDQPNAKFRAQTFRFSEQTAEALLEISARNWDFAEMGLATTLTRLGRLADAEIAIRNVLERSLKRLGRTSAHTGAVASSYANLLYRQGRYAEAVVMARAALDIFDKAGVVPESRSRAFARRAEGRANAARGQWTEALAAYQRMHDDLSRDAESAKLLGQGEFSWALALVKVGRAGDAVALIEPEVARFRELFGDDTHEVAILRGVLEMGLARLGQRARALDEFRAAIRVLAEATASSENSTPARALQIQRVAEGYIELLFDIKDSDLGGKAGVDATAEAFRIADAVRGRTVQNALSQSAARAAVNDPALALLARKEQDLAQESEALHNFLLNQLNAPPGQRLVKVMADMQSRLPAIREERKVLLADIEERFPRYATLVNPRPVPLAEARRALAPGEALVSVVSTDERTFVWAVRREGPIAFHSSPLGEQVLAGVVAGLRAALDPGDRDIAAFDLAAAHRLYAEILAPVEAGWRGAHTIVAVVSGSLATLPLSVLPTEATMSSTESKQLFAQYRNVAWLARKAALAYAPSVTTFTQLRALPAASTQRSPFAGFGDPMFSKTAVAAIGGARGFRLRSLQIERVDKNVDPAKQSVAWLDYGKLTPLPDTRDELLSIARVLGADATSDVFLGLDANRRRVKEIDLSRRRIVAFATHGLVPGDFPGLDQPALALSVLDDAKESPLLLLEDVLGLKLDADWVVLSACNTAAGDGLGADAISGLGRGFFYAGSRALLATHWPVETVSARLLTTGIFERYAKDPAVTRAQALNASMLALIDSPGSAEYSYAHPLFWAPFALFGDGGR